MKNDLPKNVTLRDLLTRLSKSDHFVSQLYGVMHYAEKEHGPILMRLGVTGTGKIPNYRFEDASSGAPFRAIDGGSHTTWTPAWDFASPENWSDTAMTLQDVKDLLGEIRNFKRT